jgi:hypothetical protein
MKKTWLLLISGLTVVWASPILFADQSETGPQAALDARWQKARDIIQRAYETLKKEEYSEYEKYFNRTQEKIATEMDKGVPLEKAEEIVLGKDENGRIAAVMNFYEERELGSVIRSKYAKFKDTVEPILSKAGLTHPVYKYVAWRESGFDPSACTIAKVGGRDETVKGFWQLLESTARDELGMTVTSARCSDGKGQPNDLTEDERFDLVKSTEAFAKYINKIKAQLGPSGNDVSLVLAAYHTGPQAIKNMIADQGANYWAWENSPENRQKYGFGPKSYDYVPYIMATAKIAGEG